ncbi:unannotated protein [freshwater metagenome]|uniref:Unannotated protein n=1 Tax=freshwater metagenome TaxID=449393 RepID=A0A6J6Q3I3_9ZZZZ
MAEKFITSADNRFAAVSNEILVLVESSKNKLTTDLPRKVGNFLFGPSVITASSLAVANKPNACSLLKSATESKWPEII